jgi:uncharacterized repeat protein (TIGR03803 family)
MRVVPTSSTDVCFPVRAVHFGRSVAWICFAAASLVFAQAESAQTKFRVLHSFTDKADGGTPDAGLYRDRAGNLYSVALEGGGSNNGVVYKMAPNGKVTTLYSFNGGNDGRRPESNLVMDTSGNLYGTTDQGGPEDSGTVYRLAPDGTETVLYAFTGGDHGAAPDNGVVIDSSGNLYGTTYVGGADGDGVAFTIPAGGTFSVIHTFTGGSDGGSPIGNLLIGKDGKFYGTAVIGGAHGWGTVFRMSSTGQIDTLYSFAGAPDGQYPNGTLIADKAGNLYGTTRAGGGSYCSNGCGTIFRLTPEGSETVLHAMKGNREGGEPYWGVVADKAGDLFVPTEIAGGAGGYGTVDELMTDGSLKVLHIFEGSSDGEYPGAGLFDAKTGTFYCTTYTGGPLGWGTAFEIRK